MRYRFFIDAVEVDEPVSWDGEEFFITRNKELFGFENGFTPTLKFWGKGSDIIKEKYDFLGLDAQLAFEVDKECSPNSWTNVIDGILNCANYSYINGQVTVMMEEADFTRTFKNRKDTSVSLDAIKSIDDKPISDLTPLRVILRSKAIIQESSLITNTALLSLTDSYQFSPATKFNLLYFPLQIGIANDLKSANELYNLINFAAPPLPDLNEPIFSNQNTGLLSDIKVSYKLKGFFRSSCSDSIEFNYSVRFIHGATVSAPNIVDIAGTSPLGGFATGIGNVGFSFDVESSFTIPGSTPFVWLVVTISNYRNFNTASPSPSVFLLSSDKDNYVKFRSETNTAETKSDVFLVHEAFAKVCEVITGQKDSFKSEFFGSTDSKPRKYNELGCQRYFSITNGLSIRNMLKKDGSKFPINISFSQLYKMMDSIFCLGMRVEYDESEKKWFVRVEKREYFFNKEPFLEFDLVANIEVKSNIDYFYNGISIGYNKWQLNNGQTNGLDEFNTGREYTILNKNANKKLEARCDAIAGGYPIEFTRREQFALDSTKDFETDNDIFVICLNRIPVTFKGVAYPAGTINESNELFTSVTNLISPDTAYNLRISPARNLERWLRFLKCSLYKKQEKVIKVGKGEGNYLMKSTHVINYCEPTCLMDENADFKNSQNCFDESGEELISPETIEFEFPCDFSIFTQIYGNAHKAIQVNCSDNVIYKGFLSSVNFKPNQSEGGTANFTLITTPSDGAAFDSGFDVGFDILI